MFTVSNVLSVLYYCIGYNFLGVWGSLSYFVYLISYNAMKIRAPPWFVERLMPSNYFKGVEKMHLLVSYGNSTIHASVLSVIVSLYLMEIVSNVWLENAFRYSIGYLVVDIIYIFDENVNHDMSIVTTMMLLLHHMLTINYENLIFVVDDSLIQLARYVLARSMLAEVAVIPLNYAWYLINTKQSNSFKFKIASSITVITYFLSRVVNFTELYYELYMLEQYFYLGIGIPIGILNYYWFYKLIMKQF